MRLNIVLMSASLLFASLTAQESPLPDKMLKIMQQDKYAHSSWGLYARDSETGKILYSHNAHKMLLPASTTKLFSVAALYNAYGDDYRFKTPVYAVGKIEDGKLNGSLVLVGQGDLTFGGRQEGPDTIAFTKMDHIYANTIPGAILTPQDPLKAVIDLAKQVKNSGIKEIEGTVLIDDRLFQTEEKRDNLLSPVFLNENLIDIVLNPGQVGKDALLTWRPMVEGYKVINQVKSAAKGEKLDIEVFSDESDKTIVVKGTIPLDSKNLVRTYSVKDPKQFIAAAFTQALQDQGIKINNKKDDNASLPTQNTLKDLNPVAMWTSPPLSEYGKLILKVSHNIGANLIPLLLAVHEGKRTYDEGMLELGKFVTEIVKISPDSFVFLDGAGGDENRLTPFAEVQLLDYMKKLPSSQFKSFYEGLPILGVDGSLEDVAKKSGAANKVYAKTGTGVSFNLAERRLFLTTQTLAGYIEGKDGHLIEFMLGVNNAKMPKIEDIFAIFEDEGQLSAIIYDLSD